MQFLSLLVFCAGLFSMNLQTESPHGAGFKISCKTCHSPKGWQLDKGIYSFNHNTTKLPLVGVHKEVGCRQCHPTLIFAEAKTSCNECHIDIHQATVGFDCSRCHTPVSWLVNNINEIHQSGRFPLVGAHRTVDCSLCHKSESLERYDVPGINCIDCHRQNYLATTNPNHIQSGISEDCYLCHKVNSFQWEGAGFDHSIFPLEQSHSSLKCSDCHKTTNFKDAKPDCYSCHEQIYLTAKNPDHLAAQFSSKCQDCHTLIPGWKPTTFDHSRFPLKLGHSIATCSDCHTGGNYLSTSPECYSCHQQNYTATVNPNHVASGFPKACETCHTAGAGWKPVNIDHSRFPLNLGHSSVACTDCHINGNYSSTSVACYSCHQQNYTSTTNPNHVTSGFVKTCETCHTLNPGWKPATYIHVSFPLTQGHSIPTCIDCHTGGNFTTTSTDCFSCHQQNYNSTTNPNHVIVGYPKTCSTCHTLIPGWKPATFNHTFFPLTLGHATPVCLDCHIGGNYTTTPADCYSCHKQNYNAATNPNHIAAGFSQSCGTCHTTTPGWKPTTFVHTGFALTLGHAIPTCNDCHTTGNYAATPADCYSCHQQNYNATTNPNHIAAGFSKLCGTCHSITPGWRPTTFVHTGFPLVQGHSIPTCNDCHKGGNYTTLSADCYSCHQQNYIAATNPNHIAAAFSTTCITCHSLIPGWKPTSFVHTGFSLTLGHSIPTCNDCHTGGNYTTISTDCYFCHQQNYIATTNPNHIAAGIPVTCATCHTTNPGWKPATFDHSIFPLTLGHSIPTCGDCHKGNYTTTSRDCYSCHQQNYTATTNPNHIAAGIPVTCATCHTINPGWKPATFNHTSFPLTLGHAIPTCADCHKGNYTSTPTDCYACHATDYNNSTNPNHKTLAFPTICTQCHTTNPGWKPASYTQHDAQMFPIYSGRHQGQWTLCTDCHTNPANYLLFDCKRCHSDVHISNNYTNAQCYSCHPRGTVG
ncbi:MAG: hypothetical protein EPN88_08450 [Bacteroidetes bacterium]|nr:MAG: hypothetical protein EPN88_08450 [Bacteroidota bacterium]